MRTAALDDITGQPLSQQTHGIYSAISTRGLQAVGEEDGNEIVTLKGEALAEFNAVADTVRAATIQALEAEDIRVTEIAAAMHGG